MPKSDRRKQVEGVILYPIDWLEERSGRATPAGRKPSAPPL
jgi:hypothetical protein